MSLHDRNRFLQILHKNGVKRNHISTILKDIDQSGIFQDSDDPEFDEYWEEIDRKACIIFGDMDIKKKKEIFIKAETEKDENLQWKEIVNNRIHQKQEEIKSTGNCSLRVNPVRTIKEKGTLPYGRTYLHEAIAMKDLEAVEKYVKAGEYLDVRDNNGHIPIQMAHYLNYKDVLEIFKKYSKKKSHKKIKR